MSFIDFHSLLDVNAMKAIYITAIVSAWSRR